MHAPGPIYLLRHPVPELASGICYGRTDIPLRPGWEASIDTLITRLPTGIRIVSSPSRRCLQPARRLADKLDAPCKSNPDLQELDFGDWEGQAWDTLDGPESRHWAKDFVHRCPPGGESFAQLQRRVRVAVQREIETTGLPLLLVTHAGPIRALLAIQHGLALNRSFEYKLDFCSLHQLDPRNIRSPAPQRNLDGRLSRSTHFPSISQPERSGSRDGRGGRGGRPFLLIAVSWLGPTSQSARRSRTR